MKQITHMQWLTIAGSAPRERDAAIREIVTAYLDDAGETQFDTTQLCDMLVLDVRASTERRWIKAAIYGVLKSDTAGLFPYYTKVPDTMRLYGKERQVSRRRWHAKRELPLDTFPCPHCGLPIQDREDRHDRSR